ncbi:Tyrosine recombinase XerC [Methylobacterium cerastii]|uniref:Tyrosine recombinase XerC n=1 Tax=Methylobacterium cerastii TaxID=932741 RepID=A0ABQ4QGT1_9HYPH|nr:site-specific integrase [Methylobacterium cerastii]GJD44090.1 Tyrosine recombinase XerC [Methylobacterium cerastii]
MADETVARQPNLTLRGGTFYLRMRVPLDVAEPGGRTHVVRSLRTKERRLAITRLRIEQAQLEREFEAVRRQSAEDLSVRRALASGRLEKLASREIETLATRWFEHAVQRVSPGSRDVSETRFTDWDAVLEEVKADGELLTSADPEDHAPLVGHVVDAVLIAAGAPPETTTGSRIRRHVQRPQVDRTTRQYVELAALVRRGLIALNRDAIVQLSGEGSSSRYQGATEALGVVPSRTLNELIAAFANDPGRGHRTGKTDADYGMIFLALREVIGGDTDVHRISRDHARWVRDLFQALPPNATKRFRGKTLTQAAEIATAGALPTLNTQTVNSHLTKCATLFNWAVREEWIAKNPAAGLAIDEAHHRRREPFSPDQLRAIFTAAIYTGCRDDEAGYARPGPNHPRRARFWVPLLSLFHGLRLNEACQLRPHDVTERDGVPVFLVRAGEADQRVKSKAGTRIVPLHPDIIELGFLSFVASARERGDQRLFPELRQDARGYFSDAFQKWFTRFLASCGAARSGTTFHSFRHGWADRLREAGVPEDRRRALGGWADTGVDAGYGRGFPTKMLAADIAAVRYSGLALSHLERN